MMDHSGTALASELEDMLVHAYLHNGPVLLLMAT